MPTFVPDTTSCGNRYAGWYNGEMPAEAGDIAEGETFILVFKNVILVYQISDISLLVL